MDPTTIIASVASGVILLLVHNLNNTMKTLSNSVTDLKTEVAVMGASHDTIKDHESRIRALETA